MTSNQPNAPHAADYESDRSLRQLVNNIDAVVWLSTSDKAQMLYVNSAYEKLFGRAVESLYADPASFLDVVHPEDRERIAASLPKQAEGDYQQVFRIVQSDGSIRWLRTRAYPICGANGRVERIAGVTEDVTDRRIAQEKLRAEQTLLRQLLDLGERERKLLAYDIHDGFVQDVVGTKMMLEAIVADHESVAPELRERLERLVELLTHAIDEGRRLISELRPLIIDEHGILAAIGYLVGEMQASDASLQIKFTHDVQFERLPPLVEGTVFRIVQEALNNVRRHSQATAAWIRLSQPAQQETMRIEISDNGVGFDQTSVPKDRFGLRGIIERARLFGGCASIESTPNRGTRVLIELPLAAPSG